jgi:hypothetical protein
VFWNCSATVAQGNFKLKFHRTELYYLLAACCDRPLPVVLKLPAFPTPTTLPAATNCLTCTAGNTPVMPDFTRCPWRLHIAIRMGDAWKPVLVSEGKSWCDKRTDHVQIAHFPQVTNLKNKSSQLRAAHLFRWKHRYSSMWSLGTLTHLSDHGTSLKHSIAEEIKLLHSQSFMKSLFTSPLLWYRQPPHCRFSSMIAHCAPLNISQTDIHNLMCGWPCNIIQCG